MSNPNVIGWIGQVEKLNNKKQYERPFHQDEQQFYLFHPPMPTENGRQLKEHFKERRKIENEKFDLKEKERSLVDKYDTLSRSLKDVVSRPVSSPEDEMKKQAEIKSIQNEIKKVFDELKKVREEIIKKDDEIDKVNEKINEIKEIVIEDEHKSFQQQQEYEKKKNSVEVDSLINQL